MGISYAKTLEDLVSEFHDAYAKDWASAKAWCDENDADLKTSFNVCKDKDVIQEMNTIRRRVCLP